MTRFRIVLFPAFCALILIVIALAVIVESRIKSDPIIVDSSELAVNPEKFSGQEIEVRRLWCHYIYPFYYCKGPEPECPMRPLSEAEKDRFAKNSRCPSATNCPGMPLFIPDDSKYDSCIRSKPPRLVVILDKLIIGETMIRLVDPGCETRDPSCLVDVGFLVWAGGYDVRPGNPTIVTVFTGRVVSR
jgi:hypothetical protein